MKRLFKLFVVAVAMIVAGCGSKYQYETVPGDALNTKIYTLDNGLKIYMTVNPGEPRLQTYIAVKVGAKNDPSETTGLAHYFEHLMFKGSEQFGTSDYAAEKPLLDQIEKEFEVYRTLTDDAERAAAYKIIDSLSYEASKYSIPNEYDKLMAAIGAQGTNAYTSYDQTVYVEDIPSNQIDVWAKIQADRFKNNVIRGFHTELETVYEEKNMSLTQDNRRVLEAMLAQLFPNHPYGQQSVLGTQEHLKNPSITNIKNYHKEWYVPNNIAICVSGDFNPDEMVATIEKYWGDFQPNKDLKKLEFPQEEPLTEPVKVVLEGQEAPFIYMAWRLPAANSEEMPVLTVMENILNNGKTGLIDVNINQAQKVLGGAGGGVQLFADHSCFLLTGRPKHGQSLEDVQNLLLEQIELLKKGEFDESMIASVVNNYKRYQMDNMKSNSFRADQFVTSFIYEIPWADMVAEIDNMSKVTKEDIVAAANKYLGNGYVAIHKEQGKAPVTAAISKPKITPILTNRDKQSAFLQQIQAEAAAAQPIEPVFVDFDTEMSRKDLKEGMEMLYKKNTDNGLFELEFMVEFGSNDNKVIPFASNYFRYLGTAEKTAEQINAELYALACDASVTVGREHVFISVYGLSENMEAALAIIEDKIANAKGDDAILANCKADEFRKRMNSKTNQRVCYSMLTQYVNYGKDNPSTYVLSNKEIQQLGSDELLAQIKGLLGCSQKVTYYGPMEMDQVIDIIGKYHNTPEKLAKYEGKRTYKLQEVSEPKVVIAPYNAKQIYMLSYSNTGEVFDPAKTPMVNMYNEYFGGGMNSIVFQEMREARGLAYSANARYATPAKAGEAYSFTSFIATQNDKMMDAVNAFDEIINQMPESEAAFNIAKENIIATLRTKRVLGVDVINYWLNLQKRGLSEDPDKALFEQVQNFTLQDVVKFQQEVIKDRKYIIAILGTEKDLDMKALAPQKYGKVERVSLEDIFGY